MSMWLHKILKQTKTKSEEFDLTPFNTVNQEPQALSSSPETNNQKQSGSP